MATFDVNTMLVRGEQMYFYIVEKEGEGETLKYTPLAFATSCSVQIDGETIDTSNKFSGKWASNLSGKNSYTISTDALYTQAEGLYSFDFLMEKMISGGNDSKLDWVIGMAKDYAKEDYELNTDAPYYSGTAFITSLSLNAGSGEVANCSISLTGSGKIEHFMPKAE